MEIITFFVVLLSNFHLSVVDNTVNITRSILFCVVKCTKKCWSSVKDCLKASGLKERKMHGIQILFFIADCWYCSACHTVGFVFGTISDFTRYAYSKSTESDLQPPLEGALFACPGG